MPRAELTDLTMVLDRSGSMASVAADTIGGVNTFLAEQRAAPGKATFTLYQFDNEFERVQESVDILAARDLTSRTFQPRGGTALLDAIGRAMIETGKRLGAMPEPERPAKVMFIIVTDGEENSSREFSRAAVMDAIRQQREKYSWEFLFLGANQDAIAAGHAIGIDADNSLTYMASGAGSRAAFAVASGSARRYRSGIAAKFTAEERREANEDSKAKS